MTFISIEHASNCKKNNGLHLISCNSGHRCVFFIQGLNGLPSTHFIYSISARQSYYRKYGSHKRSRKSAWEEIKSFLVICNTFTDTFLFAASLHPTTRNVSVTHVNNRSFPLL